MTNIPNATLNRKSGSEVRRTPDEVKSIFEQRCQSLVEFAEDAAAAVHDEEVMTFREFEGRVRSVLWELGRLLVMLFLARGEVVFRGRSTAHKLRGGQRYKRYPARDRTLTTIFGVVRYWRTYMYRVGGGGGYYPLDESLGLTGDRFSFRMLTSAVRLACKLSFADARKTLSEFVETAPSTEVIENAVLGLGRYTESFFEQAPPPDVDGPDGNVLVIMTDGKSIPTAGEQELERRRGPRESVESSDVSKRHRDREKRNRYPPKDKPKAGDKTKNGKQGNVLVMYTLRQEDDQLVGPLNVWRYCSMRSKRHAFEIAVREAAKRGFVLDDDGLFNTDSSGRRIQIVIDGDTDLELYSRTYFPGVTATLDLMHALEYVSPAGRALGKREEELQQWYVLQKRRLLGGDVDLLLADLKEGLKQLQGLQPDKDNLHKKVETAINYISKRTEMMDYNALIEEDLEITTGMVEGAVNHLMAKRFDNGGMRWIRERAEPLIQLRCIDINGQWEDFCDYVERTIAEEASDKCGIVRIQQTEPEPLREIWRDAA